MRHQFLCGGLVFLLTIALFAQNSQAPGSSSSKHSKSNLPQSKSDLDMGSVVNGTYRNRTLDLSCKIPAGWVLRTEELSSEESAPTEPSSTESKSSPQGAQGNPSAQEKVLLAAFSRPPDAKGEEVNSSILIVAEPQSMYPGLKEAAQYFGPLTEVAKAQGFVVNEEPYEIAIGSKKLVRSDFHKDVGSRVMHQSTLAMLEHGYAVSITLIGGTEDEVEDLVDGLIFSGPRTHSK